MEVARGAWEEWAPSCCSTSDRASTSEGSVRAGCEREGRELGTLGFSPPSVHIPSFLVVRASPQRCPVQSNRGAGIPESWRRWRGACRKGCGRRHASPLVSADSGRRWSGWPPGEARADQTLLLEHSFSGHACPQGRERERESGRGEGGERHESHQLTSHNSNIQYIFTVLTGMEQRCTVMSTRKWRQGTSVGCKQSGLAPSFCVLAYVSRNSL